MLRSLPSLALPDGANRNVFILIIDDDKSNFMLLEQILKEGEINNCAYAAAADEAFEMLEQKMPSLILLDIMLPGLNGFDFCQRIKQVPAYRNIPVIFISGLKGAEVRAKAFTLGGVDYLQKPYDQNEVLARVKVHLQNGLMLQALERYSINAEREMALAIKSQNSLLPSKERVRDIGKTYNFSLSSAFIPYSGLAGDFWQLLPVDETKFALVMTDFSGHGIAAALETVRFHSLLFEFNDYWAKPERLFKALNNRLCAMLAPETFATFNYCLVDTVTKKVRSYSAGGPPVLHLCPGSNSFELVAQPSSPLGIIPEWARKMEYKELDLKSGEALVLYSDALSEIPDKDPNAIDPFSTASLNELLNLNPFTSQNIKNYLLNLFYQAPRLARQDDLTLVSLVLT